MPMKKVYVETTVISDATALPTNDLTLVARQVATREWWAKAKGHFELFVSATVIREAGQGDAAASRRRLDALAGLAKLPLVDEVLALA